MLVYIKILFLTCRGSSKVVIMIHFPSFFILAYFWAFISLILYWFGVSHISLEMQSLLDFPSFWLFLCKLPLACNKHYECERVFSAPSPSSTLWPMSHSEI